MFCDTGNPKIYKYETFFFFFCRVTLHSFRDVFTNTKLQLRTSRVLIVGLNIPGRLYHLPCISFGC